MEKIICKNSYGNTGMFTNSFPYFLEDYEGIHEKVSELYGIKSAFGIGELYVGNSIPKRNIIIYGYFKDNFFERTQFLYNLFPNGDEGTLNYYEDDYAFKINYRVEKVHIDKKEPIRYFTISLICFNPYFMDLEESKVSLSEWVGGLEFPLEIIDDELEFDTKDEIALAEIENPTKIESGLRIVFSANGNVIRPTLKNIITQEVITIDFNMQIGDIIEVTTYMNNKNITLYRDGIEKNINNYLLYGTKFIQLEPGTNKFKILADDGIENLTTEIFYSIYYEAI